MIELKLPQQTITQRGGGYRMRVTPEGGGEERPSTPSHSLPKSHDFR
jgi:hypothetical protein